MSEQFPPVLSWDAIHSLAPSRTPLLVVAPAGPSRDLSISRLAAENIGQGGRVLWISAQRYATPLAWVRLREFRLDVGAKTAGPELDPFALNPVLLTQWLCFAYGLERRSDRSAMAEAVGEVTSEALPVHAKDRFEKVLAAFHEARSRLGLASDPVRLSEGLSKATSTVAPKTGFRFGDYDLINIFGSPRDLSRDADWLCLFLLSLISTSALRIGSGPDLIVLDGVLDALSARHRDLLRSALLEHARGVNGRVVIATQDPASLEGDELGYALLEAGVLLVGKEFFGHWTEVWSAEMPRIESVQPLENAIAVPHLRSRRVGHPLEWTWMSCPSPFEAPISGVEPIDVGDEDE